MSEIMIDKETFERIVCTAISASAEVFNSMSMNLQMSEQQIKREFIGKTLSDKFDELPEQVQEEAKKAICLDAFYMAIPFLDLVLTATGFGVVSNSNVAPASKERVAALSAQVRNCRDNALDGLLLSLHSQVTKEWGKLSVAVCLIDSLFFTARDLRVRAGIPDAYRTDLLKLSPKIAEAEEIFRSQISAIYFDSLITSIRTNETSDADNLVILLLQKAIGAYLSNSVTQFRTLIDRVVNTLEEDTDKYPVYLSSEAYKVKHFKRYENEQEDTTYFWG